MAKTKTDQQAKKTLLRTKYKNRKLNNTNHKTKTGRYQF